MLLKYLNELDRAVKAACEHPGLEEYSRCAECADVLKDYLRGQMEPVRKRGTEIMDNLLPEQFDDWVAQVGAARMGAVRSQAARSQTVYQARHH